MSDSVSRIEFWREANPTPSTNEKKGAQEGGPNAIYLSYDFFLVLTVLGGFFGLDHLYLRSPYTFIAKAIVNIMCFGVWWIYDMAQAFFNADVVKVFGLGVPGFGPKGIAAGVLANDVPDKKHFRFFAYAMSLIFGGLVGMDSFVLGSNDWGFIQLLCFISVIFAPVSIGNWLYKLLRFFTDTKAVVEEHSEYFGAPVSSFKDSLLARIPILGALFSPFDSIKRFFASLFGDAIEPIIKTVDGVVTTVDDTVKTVDDAIILGRNAISKGADIISDVANTVDKASRAFSMSSQVVPGASLYSTITPDSVQGELKGKAVGGSLGAVTATAIAATENLNAIHYVLLGTLVVIILGGFFTAYSRTKNVQPDDAPPEPGVLRVPDSKKRTA